MTMCTDPIRSENVDELRRRLVRQAFLFDDPTAYAAGVEDTLDALSELHLLLDGVTVTADRRVDVPA